MSILPASSIKILAEAAGIANLKDEIAGSIAPDVEYRLREIIQEATKFMRHSKRQRLTSDDVNSALRVRNVEPLYGFSPKEHLRYRRVAGAGDIFYIEDEELDCNELINSPLPKIPVEVSYTSHWLAIEGVQPAIPQNPPPQEALEADITSGVVAAVPVAGSGPTAGSSATTAPEGVAVVDAGNVGAQVTPLVKHVLSKEMQLYYEKIVATVLKPDPNSRKLAYNSLQLDPGIHQLLPYFTQFIADKITKNLKDLDLLTSMLHMVNALLENNNLFLEPYLHQLMPAILTCLVGKQLCRNPAQDDHWSLREFAARLVHTICSKYGDAYHTLQSRISKTLLRAFLDPLKPLTTHYGGIIGLTYLGKEVIRLLIVPNVKAYSNLVKPLMKFDSRTDLKSQEASRCFKALLRATGIFIQGALQEPPAITDISDVEARISESLPKDLDITYTDLINIFGDGLSPFIDDVLHS